MMLKSWSRSRQYDPAAVEERQEAERVAARACALRGIQSLCMSCNTSVTTDTSVRFAVGWPPDIDASLSRGSATPGVSSAATLPCESAWPPPLLPALVGAGTAAGARWRCCKAVRPGHWVTSQSCKRGHRSDRHGVPEFA